MLDPRNALSPSDFSRMLAAADWYLAMPESDCTAIMARGQEHEYIVVPAVPRVIAERILADHQQGTSACTDSKEPKP